MEEIQKYSVNSSNDYHNVKFQINRGRKLFYMGCLEILLRHEEMRRTQPDHEKKIIPVRINMGGNSEADKNKANIRNRKRVT